MHFTSIKEKQFKIEMVVYFEWWWGMIFGG